MLCDVFSAHKTATARKFVAASSQGQREDLQQTILLAVQNWDWLGLNSEICAPSHLECIFVFPCTDYGARDRFSNDTCPIRRTAVKQPSACC